MQMETIIVNDITKIITVYGADSYIGTHLIKHLERTDRMVYGFSQNKDLNFEDAPMMLCGREKITFETAPIISDWIIICLDPRIGLDNFIARMKNLCNYLVEQQYWGRICFVSSGSICLSSYQAISEETVVSPRTQNDLALSIGENFLNVMLHQKNNNSGILTVRIGVPYGNETGMSDTPGMINELIRDARYRKTITVPQPLDMKRSCTHISDICESIIGLITLGDLAPSLVNIPGEVLNINDIIETVGLRVSETF